MANNNDNTGFFKNHWIYLLAICIIFLITFCQTGCGSAYSNGSIKLYESDEGAFLESLQRISKNDF